MQTHYLSAADKVVLTVDPTQVAVRFREPAPHNLRLAVAAGTPNLAMPSQRYEVPGEKYTVFPVDGAGADPEEAFRNARQSLEQDPSVVRVAPVFVASENRLIATDRVVVGFRREATGPIFQLEQRGFQVVDQREAEYLVRLREHDDPLEVASELARLPDAVFAEPDFVEFGEIPEPGPTEPTAQPDPGDLLAGSQWARPRTRADEAMSRLPNKAGDPSIRIAVLDAGVDAVHPDLAERIVGVFDASDEPPPDNPQPHDWHGTACAGLAAAIPNNGKGIRGFGGGCSILAVRIFYSTGEPKRWKLSSFAIKRGIDWAVDNGADVLSLSWTTTQTSHSIANAIERALVHGRNTKGCVVVAGTGNDTSVGVKFPARLPGVVAVAATDKLDRPVDVNASGTGWASAGGPEVALAAPGISHVTTDNSGKAGKVVIDYVHHFDRTSSATAVVAGAAGLVLSANPKLKGDEVREILRATADKVKTVTYDANGHNDRVGSGRLNLLAAVEDALKR